MSRHPFQLAALLLLAASLCGCATESRSFPGYSPEQVWTAILTVSRNPDYSDPTNPSNRWTVMKNSAWVEEDNYRVEIYRELRRVLIREGAQPLDQSREWMFTVTMKPVDPPRVDFRIRNDYLPAHGWREENRFFDDLRTFLDRPAGLPEEQTASAGTGDDGG